MREQIYYPGLPLAIYREIAAHLRQIEGVETGLVSQQSPEFDYLKSQIDHLWLEYETNLETGEKQKLEAILSYYGQRHSDWQREVISP